MDIRRVQAEMTAVEARIVRLSSELDSARHWMSELAVSLAVLKKLGDTALHPALPSRVSSVVSHTPPGEEVTAPAVPRRRQRSDVITRAGNALVALLRERQSHIKQFEAVQLLLTRHDIVVGNGVPGRETSDLSAALGAGKFPPLVVSRTKGWGLTEWNDALQPDETGNDVVDAHAEEALDDELPSQDTERAEPNVFNPVD